MRRVGWWCLTLAVVCVVDGQRVKEHAGECSLVISKFIFYLVYFELIHMIFVVHRSLYLLKSLQFNSISKVIICIIVDILSVYIVS